MLNPEDRDVLRRRAVQAWSHAKELVGMAQDLTCGARQARSISLEARLVARNLRVAEVGRVDGLLADRAEPSFRGASLAMPGVGLVVAGRVERIGSLGDVLHEHVGRVCSARDPAIAVGLAILEQPDVAVLDDDLPLMSGLDTAVLIRAYAPASSLLLLTDDPATSRAAAIDGIPVAEYGDPAGLRDILDRLVA